MHFLYALYVANVI